LTDKDGSQQSINLTISVGIATVGTTRFATMDDFVAAADRCLYQAKRAGRNRVSSGIGD
jgi:diguanylate cyclase (GGDEF)-like protein